MKYGLIGEKLGHSFSLQIHEMFGNTEYELREIPAGELDAYMQDRSFDGINVTIPYKQAVMEFCECDEVCLAIGSANTIVNRNGRLYAYNTDCKGLLFMLKRAGIELRNKKVVILGSGGTARTAVYTAYKEGAAEIYLLSRRKNDAEVEFPRCKVIDYSDLSAIKDAEVLINTTPVGMYPGNGVSPLSISDLNRLEAVADVIYNPMRTELLLEASERGLKVTDGLPMLVAQAWYAHCLFEKQDDSKTAEEEIERVLSCLRQRIASLSLIGMPGSGKSTVGRELAKQLKLNFADADEIFEKKYNCSPGEYITRYGEEAFREEECKVIAELTARNGMVIATGGGAILRKENRRALHQNGIVIYLDRALENLDREGRPLSKDTEAILELYRIRRPLYEECADYIVEVKENDIQAVVEEICRLRNE